MSPRRNDWHLFDGLWADLAPYAIHESDREGIAAAVLRYRETRAAEDFLVVVASSVRLIMAQAHRSTDANTAVNAGRHDPLDIVLAAIAYAIPRAVKTWKPEVGAWATHLHNWTRRLIGLVYQGSFAFSTKEWHWNDPAERARTMKALMEMVREREGGGNNETTKAQHSLAELVPVTPVEPPDLAASDARARMLARLIEKLPPRYRGILRARYGLDGGPPASVDAVAKGLGKTRVEVRQMEVEAMRRLGAM